MLKSLAAAKARAEKLAALQVTIMAKSGSEGKLFGSVTNANIAEAIVAQGVEASKSEVRMPEGPIRMGGEYDIGLHLHAEVNATVKVIVIGEEE